MKKIAVVLSGCGYLDGTEITEAISILIAIGQNGAEAICFAPNIDLQAVNHLTKQSAENNRNVLEEAARIARSKILPLNQLDVKKFDALAFPGGFGAAKNLSSWAFKGAQSEVNPEVAKVILDFYNDSKPIAAACIAPVLLAKVLGKKRVTVTVGNDPATIAEVEKTGAQHETCPVDDYITDRETKVVTTPAYMYDDAKPHEVFQGISGMVKELVEWA